MGGSNHHLEVNDIPVENAADLTAIGNARDPLLATGGTGTASLLGRQRGIVLVRKVDIPNRPTPIQISGFVRLIIGAAFDQGNGGEGPSIGGCSCNKNGSDKENQD